jgi:hypothetical protein
VRICSFCGSNKDVRKPRDYGGDLCIKHYTQYRRYGKLLDRTRYDKNEIIKNNEYAEVILYDKNQEEIARVKDAEKKYFGEYSYLNRKKILTDIKK